MPAKTVRITTNERDDRLYYEGSDSKYFKFCGLDDVCYN